MWQVCIHSQAKTAGDKMLCQMPVVSLPDDLTEQLLQSESGTINNTDGPGVAVYVSPDERTRADIYIGLKLDGLKLYWNISSVKPNIKMKFSVQPNIYCESGDVYFNPNKDKVMTIQVSRWQTAALNSPVDEMGERYEPYEEFPNSTYHLNHAMVPL